MGNSLKVTVNCQQSGTLTDSTSQDRKKKKSQRKSYKILCHLLAAFNWNKEKTNEIL